MSAKIENQLLTTTNNDESSSKDEVDFIRTKTYPPPTNNNIKDSTINSTTITPTTPTKLQCPLLMKKLTPGTLYGDCEVKTSIKSSLSTLEKFTFFTLHRRHNSQNSINNNNNININNNNNNNCKLNNTLIKSNESTTSTTIIKESPKNKFVKSASIARLLGNTYNTKKIENELLKLKYNQNNNINNSDNINNNNNCNKSLISDKNYGVRRRNLCSSQNINNNNNKNGGIRNERFQKCSKLEDELSSNNYNLNNNNNNFNNNNNSNSNTNNCEINLQDFHDDHTNDISAKAFRTISRSIGKLWWKRTHSIEISQPDPEFKVSYLGNVLTGWAKGDGCIEKPINTLWRNYTQNHKPDVVMRIKICASGLKATTRQHGLTEYWANRITYCCSPKNYSRVFCWIYRHEGRKLKHELRCHAVLCSKESIAQDICNMLRENLDRALADFKREKLLKQNARLSLANSVYENPSLPRRKILLSVGGNNYRPPMERSKSAPKLMAIEEAIGEEDGEDIEQTNEPEMAACCQKDSLYPAMTLGRRRCRRGHSIRRTGKPYKSFCGGSNCISATAIKTTIDKCTTSSSSSSDKKAEEINITTKSNSSLAGSDEDDFDKLLSNNNYDTTSPLAGELLSYFDMKMHNGKASSLTNLNEHDEHIDIDRYDLYEPSLTTDPSPRPCTLSLDNLDNCSDLECGDDCMTTDEYDDDDHDIYDKEDQLFYHQSAILNILHRNSLRKMANLSMSSDDSNSIDLIKETIQINDENQRIQQRCSSGNDTEDFLIQSQQQKQQLQHLDSDEGSISSGCETASTVTTNLEESSLKYISNQDEQSVDDDNQRDLNRENQQIIREKLNGGLVMPSFDSVNQRYLNAIKNLNENNTSNNNNDVDDADIKISSNTLSLQQLPKPSIRRQFSGSIRNENRLNLNENSEKSLVENIKRNKKSGGECNDGSGGEVSDSEFSDESGYVEYQDQFGSQQSKNDTIKRLIA